MQDLPSSVARRPVGHSVSPSSSRRNSLASGSNYPVEPEVRQCLRESNDSHTERPESTIAGSRVSANDSTNYKRVAGEDTDDAVVGAELPKSRVDFFTILTDCAAVLLPLGVIAFIVMVWRLNGTESTADSRGVWQNAITILATVFPILFASVVGRLTYEAARWKLGNGTTLGSLEQLIGSRTVGATMLNLIQLRSFNILGVALVAIWALSPLGTQSILRMMSSQISHETRPVSVTYFDTNAKSQAMAWAGWVGFSYSTSMASFRPMSTLYNTLISMPEGIKADAMDVWGNVKIPFLEHLDTNDWKQLDQNSNVIEYSSLAGIPVNNIGVGNTIFSLESSYMSLDCSDVETLTLELGDDDILKEKVFSEELSAAAVSYDSNFTRSDKLLNGTWHGYDYTRNLTGLDATWILALDRFIDRIWSMESLNMSMGTYEGPLKGKDEDMHRPFLFKDEQGIEVKPSSLLFQSIFPPQEFHPGCSVKSRCRVTQEYVESRVNCSRITTADNQNCTVVAQRKSQKQNAPRDISQLSFPSVFDFVSRELPLSIGGSTAFKSEFSLYHLADPGLGHLRSEEYCIMENVTAKDMGTRLSQLLNTYLLLSQLSFEIAEWDAEKPTSGSNITVPTEASTPIIIFRVSALWSTLFLVSSAVLLAAGISSVVFKHWTYGPEVLGYASTVLRDSRFVDVPTEHRWLDGIELSRKMKAERLRFGLIRDINEGQPLIGVGHQQSTDRLARPLH